MKSFISYTGVLACILCIVFIFVVYADDRGRSLLINYGWEISKYPISQERITIPKEFDTVYEDYNNLQKQAGLDLEQYKGCDAIRYTYKVKNHPSGQDDVVANVIVINHTGVAGDICTYSLNGFMHSLRYSK